MVSLCLPFDALLQHLSFYLGFSYLGRGVSLHGCSSKAQLMLLTLVELLLSAATPNFGRGVAHLGHSCAVAAWCFRSPPRLWTRGSFSQPCFCAVHHSWGASGNTQNSPNQASSIVNCELPDVQAGFRKGRGTRDQIANILWIIKKAREFQKNIYFFFIDYAKAFDCMDVNKLWKILKEMGIPNHLTAS